MGLIEGSGGMGMEFGTGKGSWRFVGDRFGNLLGRGVGGGGGSPVGGFGLGRLIGGDLLLGGLGLESGFLVVAAGEGGTVVFSHPWCWRGRKDDRFVMFGGWFGVRCGGLGCCG